MKSRVGMSSWQGKAWNKRFFPKDLPKKDELNYLSRHMPTIEINSTFYRLTNPKTLEGWRNQTAPGFLFSLKLTQLFTHFRRLKLEKKDLASLEYFFEGAKALKDKIGAILIQLPPNFKADHKILRKFLGQIKTIEKKLKLQLRLAVEFRHPSWFNEETEGLLKKEKVAFVIANSPHWPSKVTKTADFLYVRLHGKVKLFASKYTTKELKDWAKKLNKLKAKESFVYFNNDASTYAAENAMDLQRYLDSQK